MRLLRTKDLQLEEFFGSSTPPYAILSHTWSREEISFHDMQSLAEKRSFGLSTSHAHRQSKIKSKGGYAKIASACAQAAKDNHDYIWIDTCCIDKSSSAELSEAINSMFRYYKEAEVCYAYLSDVWSKPGLVSFNHYSDGEMRKSRWWSRGWTLYVNPLHLSSILNVNSQQVIVKNCLPLNGSFSSQATGRRLGQKALASGSCLRLPAFRAKYCRERRLIPSVLPNECPGHLHGRRLARKTKRTA